jgi:hypothetical protein
LPDWKNSSSSRFCPSFFSFSSSAGGVLRTICSAAMRAPLSRPIQTPEKKAAIRQRRRTTKATIT